MDHNVHGGIVQGVRGRGVDCLTAGEDGMAVADDESILRRAGELGRVVFTQDVDFFEIAHRWLNEGREFGGVIFARQMGITVGDAVRDLELIAKVMEPGEMRNWIEYIPLR